MALPATTCSPELCDALRRPTLRWVQAAFTAKDAELHLVEQCQGTGDAEADFAALAEQCQGPDPSLLLFFASRNLCYLIVWCPEAQDTTAKVRGAGCGCGSRMRGEGVRDCGLLSSFASPGAM